MFYTEQCLSLFSCLCKSVVNLYNSSMQPGVPERPTRPRWRKCVIVFLVGLAYLAVVYLAVPGLRRQLLYGYPSWEPEPGYRVGSDIGLRNFEERLIAKAETIGRLRLTAETTPPVHTWMGSESIEPYRPKATLLLDQRKGRIWFRAENENGWSAWVDDGCRGFFLSTNAASYSLGLTMKELRWSYDKFHADDELNHIMTDHKVLLYPYVCPNGFRKMLRAARVTFVGEAAFRGQTCRIIRVVTQHDVRHMGTWDLWILHDQQRLVKVVHSSSDGSKSARPLDPDKDAVSSVCILTSFDDDATFSDEDFDPEPVAREWEALVPERVRDELEKRRVPGGGILRVPGRRRRSY